MCSPQAEAEITVPSNTMPCNSEEEDTDVGHIVMPEPQHFKYEGSDNDKTVVVSGAVHTYELKQACYACDTPLRFNDIVQCCFACKSVFCIPCLVDKRVHDYQWCCIYLKGAKPLQDYTVK